MVMNTKANRSSFRRRCRRTSRRPRCPACQRSTMRQSVVSGVAPSTRALPPPCDRARAICWWTFPRRDRQLSAHPRHANCCSCWRACWWTRRLSSSSRAAVRAVIASLTSIRPVRVIHDLTLMIGLGTHRRRFADVHHPRSRLCSLMALRPAVWPFLIALAVVLTSSYVPAWCLIPIC